MSRCNGVDDLVSSIRYFPHLKPHLHKRSVSLYPTDAQAFPDIDWPRASNDDSMTLYATWPDLSDVAFAPSQTSTKL